jgi:hypothetical protein
MASTTEPSSLPAAAEAANVNTLATALEETHITENNESKDGKSGEKVEEGDSLEEGEIRDDDDEEDDGKPKTVFDSKKNYNLKVCLELSVKGNEGLTRYSTHCLRNGHYISIHHKVKCCLKHLDLHLLHHRVQAVCI